MRKSFVRIVTAIDEGKLKDLTFAEGAAVGLNKPLQEVTAIEADDVHDHAKTLVDALFYDLKKAYVPIGTYYFGPSNNRNEGLDRDPAKVTDQTAPRCLYGFRMGLYWASDPDDPIWALAFSRKANAGVSHYIGTCRWTMTAIDNGLLKADKLGLVMPEKLQLVYSHVQSLLAA